MNLDSSISELPRVGAVFAKKFQKLGVNTIDDLFYHVPSRYLDYSLVTTINKLRAQETVTIHAKIVSITNVFSKRGVRMQIGSVEDATGKLMVVWFNQPFLTRTLYPGRLVSLSGKVSFFNRKLCLSSPDYELIEDEDSKTLHTGHFVPVYAETAGLSSKWIRRIILNSFEKVETPEFIPSEILTRFGLAGEREAIGKVHFPKDLKEVEIGRKRLGFNEILELQLKSEYRKLNWSKTKVKHKLTINQSNIKQFTDSLPFKLTESQIKSIDEILKDIGGNIPMNRLLEGDVGSGKTVVAAVGAFAAFLNGYQTLIMAPTQILANQHYQTLKQLFDKFNIRISLVTSQVRKIELGRSDVFVGTHSLIQSKTDFDKVAFVVIDEQHRFGVEQRAHLVKRSGTPHVLTMTATPIPRTIALTTYGDLDLSILHEMPKGRQKITTWVVSEKKREGAYDWIEKQIKENKSQAFIVCPLIEDSESETLTDVKSVTTEFEKLKKIFRSLKLGLLHGRLKSKEKEQVLKDFKEGKTHILVATPVVEVGIDIPNATIMVIEAAERFGLAQLHQLRGRVGRGQKQSYCLLFSNFHSGTSYSRLKAMEKTDSGFELAELDLKLRGPGEIFGTAQSGFPELKVASWNDFTLIKSAKEVALDVIKNPKKYPLLKTRFEASLV
ncbi:MAG TPA: ATP-dependent DNA helicase RecG [Patescibacteria group bacterium]|nr:ATP-dependent DNA helicase RecG [Patescibacteria group bacterium]